MLRATIKAAEYYLPKSTITNSELAALFPEWPPEKIEEKLGIITRHIAAPDEFSSDLAVKAAKKLFLAGTCAASDIDFLLFCTQTPDYLLPSSSCLIQDRLSIPTTAGALDFNLGCSGFVYGLGIAKGLIESGQANNVLLLTGETYSKLLMANDKSTRTLFGDAGAATLISSEKSDTENIGPFIYGTDGTGGDYLMVREGGMRFPGIPLTESSGLCMKGGEIFTFSAREVATAVEELLRRTNQTRDTIDLFIFHQANAYMLEFLRKKCEIPEDKFFTWFATTGNTVSNTIPIALHHAMAAGKIQKGSRVMFVGFGVGLSWGACLAEF